MPAPGLAQKITSALRRYRPGKLAHGAVQGSFWHALRLSSQILTILIVARALGADGYGALTGMGGTALILGSLCGMGSSSLLLQYSTRSPAKLDHYWSASLRIIGQTAFVLVPLHLVICQWLLPGTALTTIAAIALAELLCYPLIIVCSAAFHAREQLGWATALSASISLFRLLAALAFWLLPAPTLEKYGLLHLLASTLALALTLVLTHRQLRPQRLGARYTATELRQGLGFSLSTMTGLGYEEIDKLIAVKLTSTGDTGAYTIAFRIVRALALPAFTLLQAAQPRLIAGLHHGQGEQVRQLLRLLLTAILLYIPVAIGLLAAASHLVQYLGAAFAPASAALWWLLPLIPLFSLRLLASTLLTSAARPDLKARHELAGTTLLAAGCLLLIPLRGIEGAMIATVISETCLLAGTAWSAWRIVRQPSSSKN